MFFLSQSFIKNLTFLRHSVKRIQIRSFFSSVFFHIQIEYGEYLSVNKYRPEKTPSWDTFHAECLFPKHPKIYQIFVAVSNLFICF